MQGFALKNGYSEDLQYALGAVPHGSYHDQARDPRNTQSTAQGHAVPIPRIPIDYHHRYARPHEDETHQYMITKDFVHGVYFGAAGVVVLILLIVLIVRLGQRQAYPGPPPMPYIPYMTQPSMNPVLTSH